RALEEEVAAGDDQIAADVAGHVDVAARHVEVVVDHPIGGEGGAVAGEPLGGCRGTGKSKHRKEKERRRASIHGGSMRGGCAKGIARPGEARRLTSVRGLRLCSLPGSLDFAESQASRVQGSR